MNSKTNKEDDNLRILSFTTDIVSSFVTKNNIAAEMLPELIKSVYNSLLQASISSNNQDKNVSPAVAIKDSITEDYIICLEDGEKLKMLKRYIRTRFGLSPDEYRQRWSLPSNYPMVAPSYAKKRSEFAKKAGLGKKRGTKIN
ncbi:MAG: MucR family transcriptional regulator [Robiginitomaculum sp.]|nr:MucR family transcriptional regulator [Robiginitomaculum sp.]